jgi:hypothetical protein
MLVIKKFIKSKNNEELKMYFDWITWSIWLVGFAILVIWVIVPIKEFKKLVQKRMMQSKIKDRQS